MQRTEEPADATPTPHSSGSSNPKLVKNLLNAESLDTESSLENGCYHGDSAVLIRNVCKQYDDGPPILQNFCMNVTKGTIYGLLGSSGCGKTTILSCIVGLKKCDSGELLVFGRKPGTKGSGIPGKRLGYMPQELALYNHLTVREIIQFYGRVYGMTNNEIKKQWDFLNTLLKLPSNFQLIVDLSGGQQRRVSLALALIHSPQLLILDEPTVGLDPLLRKDIWDYLYKIVNKLRSTIIITTHYIEEARNSNMIGVMRNGRLLVEDSPWNLLHDNNCELLEQVVLELCRKDALGHMNAVDTPTDKQERDTKLFKSSWSEESDLTVMQNDKNDGVSSSKYLRAVEFDDDVSPKVDGKGVIMISSTNRKGYGCFHFLQRIYGFTVVVLMTFIRHPVFIGVTLFTPCFQGTLSIMCLGAKPRGIHLGIVNHELANWSIECDSSRHLFNSCDFSALSCKFLHQLKSDDIVVLTSCENEAEALSQAQSGRISGYLTLPHNYSEHTLDLLVEKRFAVNTSITGSRIHAHLDYSNRIQVFLVTKHLFSSFLKYIKDLAISCHIGGQEAELPILFRKPLYNNEDDYTTSVIPGVILGSLSLVGYVLTGVMLVSDRKQGTLSRAHVAGLTPGDVLTSHMITQGIIAISQLVLWNAILFSVFSFQSAGSPVIMFVFFFLTQLCGSALGILAAEIFDEEIYVLSTAMVLGTFFLFLGCVVSPMECMVPFWRCVAYAVPITVPSMALESLAVRGIGFSHPLVLSGLMVLLGWIVILLFGSVVLYKKFNK